MVDDNYEGAETDKEAISDGGRGWEKRKRIFVQAKLKEKNLRAQGTKSHERAMQTIKNIVAELGHPRNIFERDRKPPPLPPSIHFLD